MPSEQLYVTVEAGTFVAYPFAQTSPHDVESAMYCRATQLGLGAPMFVVCGGSVLGKIHLSGSHNRSLGNVSVPSEHEYCVEPETRVYPSRH